MAEEITDENATVTTGRDLLDATQNAVINAVENVSEIIDNKDEKSISAEIEQIVEPKEPFYLETEFWVAMAFCLVVVGLFLPISKVVKKLLRGKIDSVTERIQNAVNLRDEAQVLLADYERKLNSAKDETLKIVNDAVEKIEREKNLQITNIEDELARQNKNVEQQIELSISNVQKEISELICDISVKNVKKICRENISDAKKDELIEKSISLIGELAER